MKTLLFLVCVVFVAAGVYGLAPTGATGPRVLIVAGYGDDGTNLATTSDAMEARGWTVTSERSSGLVGEAETIDADYDVVWVLPGTNHKALHDVADDILTGFAASGGAVIMPGISAENPGLGVFPGGVSVLPEPNSGATTIDAPTHPLIAAAASGGVDLTAADLDPEGVGGACHVEPGTACECLAGNGAGPVLATYDLGAGHVVLCTFDMLSDACLTNLMIYTESMVSGQ